MNINPLTDLIVTVEPTVPVRAGSIIYLSARAKNKLWRRNTSYGFTTTAGRLLDVGRDVRIDTSKLKPGIYAVTVRCIQGIDPADRMETTVHFTVRG